MAGLVPAISLRDALCQPKRDARHKAGHDGREGEASHLENALAQQKDMREWIAPLA
jgi:hypothetical protein